LEKSEENMTRELKKVLECMELKKVKIKTFKMLQKSNKIMFEKTTVELEKKIFQQEVSIQKMKEINKCDQKQILVLKHNENALKIECTELQKSRKYHDAEMKNVLQSNKSFLDKTIDDFEQKISRLIKIQHQQENDLTVMKEIKENNEYQLIELKRKKDELSTDCVQLRKSKENMTKEIKKGSTQKHKAVKGRKKNKE
jgi:hypothetical protein